MGGWCLAFGISKDPAALLAARWRPHAAAAYFAAPFTGEVKLNQVFARDGVVVRENMAAMRLRKYGGYAPQ
jgi:hypothetical protein